MAFIKTTTYYYHSHHLYLTIYLFAFTHSASSVEDTLVFSRLPVMAVSIDTYCGLA